ncbi:glycosyltransferase family 25 LPS biosynthesis protein [Nitzschia inconspicua]|uniref:Glycosyltransferase family 25 LPS biosynthesis protein n=1 Tax=Nitzschia inconspicua TaxID=303405 RepID=A0A9K3PB07_9STRA|nr:glycosyltransferase family 25 LPS biosynthesis protein [Nitzschia inconspicua]
MRFRWIFFTLLSLWTMYYVTISMRCVNIDRKEMKWIDMSVMTSDGFRRSTDTLTSATKPETKGPKESQRLIHGNNNNQIKSPFRIQSFVISLHHSKVQDCMKRNRLSGINATWFPASNGNDQVILDEWYALTMTKRLNASLFKKGFKSGYENPHVVGCYMSHWNLLKLTLSYYQTLQQRPDALVILEDDVACSNNLHEYLEATIPKLPHDWDLFMIGGKPFSYLSSKPLNTTIVANKTNPDLFQQLACQGVFGTSLTGPFAPQSRSRYIDPTRDAYWKIEYMTDTHAYVVNPLRLEYLVDFLGSIHQQITYMRPIDITYADAMRSGHIQAYMPTQEYCRQHSSQHQELFKAHPTSWKGYYHHPSWQRLWDNQPYEYGPMFFEHCPARDQGVF